jgi:RNA polymerase sigma factor (sigma-70 family)
MPTEAPLTTRQVVETVLLDPQERRGLIAYARIRHGIQDQDAEDLLQDTAFDLLRQRRYVHSPQGFVFAVFRSRCRHFIRSRRVHDRLFKRSETHTEQLPGSTSVEKMERRLVIRQALDGISSICRRLLAAHYIHGQSLREAAARMTVAYSGVSTTITRCLRKLKACLS